MSFFNSLWYDRNLLSFLLQLPLLPFSCVFSVIAAARSSLYANGICRKTGPIVPVVVIGGITVGGTGKTPICIALVKELQIRGYNPGVLTRGYKSHCPAHPCQVPLHCDPYIYGDEPSLIRNETRVPVVIDRNRARGADYLVGLGVDVIVTDDGLQHYALDRDVEICVLDGSRMLGNGHLLPAGPLREAKWRLKTVDSIVVSGAVAHLGYFPMMLKPASLQPLIENSHEVLQPKSEICAFSGIGNPDRFYKTLEDYGYVIRNKYDAGDHGRVSFEKLKKLALKYPVVMTAKDAIKYKYKAEEQNLTNIYVLNVVANLSKQFYEDVVNKIKQSNYKVAQRRKKREADGYVQTEVEPIDPIEPPMLAQESVSVKASSRASKEGVDAVNVDKYAGFAENNVMAANEPSVMEEPPATIVTRVSSATATTAADAAASSNTAITASLASASTAATAADSWGTNTLANEVASEDQVKETRLLRKQVRAKSRSASANDANQGFKDVTESISTSGTFAQSYDPSSLPSELKRKQ